MSGGPTSEGLSEEMMLEREGVLGRKEGRAIQAEGIAGAKTLRQKELACLRH